MSKRIDRTGQRFGKLVVVEMLYGQTNPSGKRVTKCRCRCDCGNEKIVMSDFLVRCKNNPSCGCDFSERRSISQRKDLTGKRFGRLIVKEMIWTTKPSKCACVCDCGNEKVISGVELTTGHTKSCGCLQKERANEANTKDFTGYVSQYGVKILRPAYQTPRGVWKWECECGLCGSHFKEIPARIKNGHVKSCGCQRKSMGEIYIENMLIKNNCEYSTQYSFSDCKYKYILKFDFAVFKNNVLMFLIEYDGRQHYIPVDFFGGEISYKETQDRDRIKDEYCKQHNIPLLRLPYTLTAEEINDTFDKFYKSVETAGGAWQQAS